MRWLGSILLGLLLCGCHRHITDTHHTADTLIVTDTVSIERVVEVVRVSHDTIREEVRTILVLGADSAVVHSATERSTYVSRNNDTASSNNTIERTASKRAQSHKENQVRVVEVEQPLSSLQRTIMGIGWMFLAIILLSGVYLLVYKRRT